MHRTTLTLTAAALMASGLQGKSRDPGPADKRETAVDTFDRITVAGPFMVRIRTGNEPGISLAGPRTMLDDTELFVRDGQLIIRWQEGASWSRNGNHGVDIDIKVPTLREATMAGAGSIDIDQVRADDFVAIIIGAGEVSVEGAKAARFRAQMAGAGSLTVGRIDAKTVEVDLAGSGNLRATGNAERAALKVMGSGSFDSPDFTASNATIVAAGSGAIRAAVSNTADIESIGSGPISLTGGAKCSVSKMGSGNVHCS